MFLHAEHYYPFKRIAMKQEYTCYTSWTLAFVVDRKGERKESRRDHNLTTIMTIIHCRLPPPLISFAQLSNGINLSYTSRQHGEGTNNGPLHYQLIPLLLQFFVSLKKQFKQ